MADDRHIITEEATLRTLYDAVNPTSLLKELDHVSEDYAKFIAASPFVILSTVGPEGVDCSPRGDPAGFVIVENSRTLLIPDRRGNNRLDSLCNIVRDPRIALLFMIPGVGETMRVNGRAAISVDPELLARFEMQGKLPRTVIVVTVEACYPQCQKALARSRLWDENRHLDRKSLPTVGEMMQRIDKEFDGKAYDAAYPERMKQTIY
jgi:hypothetical protein